MQKPNNLQDIFLTHARRAHITVILFLMNGYQLRGIITGFDSFVVILVTDGKQQMIYKHAISTIVPERPISLEEELEAE
jgi:host factor-I protein